MRLVHCTFTTSCQLPAATLDAERAETPRHQPGWTHVDTVAADCGSGAGRGVVVEIRRGHGMSHCSLLLVMLVLDIWISLWALGHCIAEWQVPVR